MTGQRTDKRGKNQKLCRCNKSTAKDTVSKTDLCRNLAVYLRPTVLRQPVMGLLLLILLSVCLLAAAYPPLSLLPVAFR